MVRNKQYLFFEYSPVGKITPEVKRKNSKRVFTGGVRIGRAMYRTDEQAAKYREDSLRRKLP